MGYHRRDRPVLCGPRVGTRGGSRHYSGDANPGAATTAEATAAAGSHTGDEGWGSTATSPRRRLCRAGTASRKHEGGGADRARNKRHKYDGGDPRPPPPTQHATRQQQPAQGTRSQQRAEQQRRAAAGTQILRTSLTVTTYPGGPTRPRSPPRPLPQALTRHSPLRHRPTTLTGTPHSSRSPQSPATTGRHREPSKARQQHRPSAAATLHHPEGRRQRATALDDTGGSTGHQTGSRLRPKQPQPHTTPQPPARAAGGTVPLAIPRGPREKPAATSPPSSGFPTARVGNRPTTHTASWQRRVNALPQQRPPSST